MERIALFSCVLSVLICSVHCQDKLAIDFKIVAPDNTSRTVNNGQVSADSASNDRVHIICRKNDIPNMADFSVIKLFKMTQNGEQELATMQTRLPSNNGFKSPYLVASGDSMQAVGSYSDTEPTLGISLPINKLSCNDQHAYKCNLSYGVSVGSSYSAREADVSRNLTVSVLPSNMELTAFNQSFASFAGMQITNSGLESTSMAPFMVGQVIKLTCKASFGTHNNGQILWRKSNIVAGSGLASYIPNQGQHEEGQVTPNGCQFEKTDSIMYNMTDQDTTRSASNPLQFQCYISAPSSSSVLPEATWKHFYIKVYNANGGPETGGLATAGSSGNVGAIIGGVIGALVGIILICAVVWICYFRRGSKPMCPGGESYTTKEEQGASNPNLAPEPHYTESTKKGKENKALDEPHEPSGHYANEFYDNRNGNRGRKNKAMDYDDDDYHSRDGSPTMNHSTHMGVDPVHGSIGTGV